MLAKVNTCAVIGLDGTVVEVEVDISQGLPAFNVVGLPDTAVQEAREPLRDVYRPPRPQYLHRPYEGCFGPGVDFTLAWRF